MQKNATSEISIQMVFLFLLFHLVHQHQQLISSWAPQKLNHGPHGARYAPEHVAHPLRLCREAPLFAITGPVHHLDGGQLSNQPLRFREHGCTRRFSDPVKP